ncbi:FCD domain-containing protein [Streptomyces sp. NPDC059894]|uniref:FCD domain-containing protein n=1 Tax=unclassified Streptomyces TaxID=2593676 RepID=UPI0036539A75
MRRRPRRRSTGARSGSRRPPRQRARRDPRRRPGRHRRRQRRRPGRHRRRQRRFHNDIVELAGNPLLTGIMRPLEARTHWLFRLTAQRDAARQCTEHEQLYEAIVAGDGDRAASLAHDHVATGRQVSVALAAEWTYPEIDPEAVAARRRRRR